MFTTVSPAPVAPAVKTPKAFKDFGAAFAVIDIEATGDFKPRSVDTVPSEGLHSIPADLACKIAVVYNSDWHSIRKNAWACVTLSGCTFFVNGVPPIDRPSAPTDYPPTARTGLTYEEAQEIQTQANFERLKVARVPKHWTVAIRPLGMLKGGA